MEIVLVKDGEYERLEVTRLSVSDTVIEFDPKHGWRGYTPDMIVTPLQLVKIDTQAPFINSRSRPAFVVESTKTLLRAVLDGDVPEECIL